MRKTKHLFLALLAVTGLSTTTWASDLPGTDPDSNVAKTSYTVQWTGESNVIYTALPQNGFSASYVDGNDVSHTLSLTFTNGTEVINTPNYPVKVGSWTVTAHASQPDVTLLNDTAHLNIQRAPVFVTGALAEIAKFADGSPAGVVTNNGVLNGVLGNDDVTHRTTAIFSDYNTVDTGKTITLWYSLMGSDTANYYLNPSSQFFTNSGVVIPNMLPDLTIQNTDVTIAQNGIDIYAYGYCTGTGYSIAYHLVSGAAPDQYRIDFADTRITDVNWTALSTPGATGTVDINLPVDLPTGDYVMCVIFRNSIYPGLESQPLTVTIHVNLPETYTMPLFDNVIALVDTCNCFTDIQWYHRADATSAWAPIPGANGYYYREEGGLTGEYFVKAKMNGVDTYTCPQTDMATLIADDKPVTVNAYPNPTSESVTISIEGSDATVHTLSIISTMGVEMLRGTFEGTSVTVDMQSYPRGSYMVAVDGMVVRVIRN